MIIPRRDGLQLNRSTACAILRVQLLEARLCDHVVHMIGTGGSFPKARAFITPHGHTVCRSSLPDGGNPCRSTPRPFDRRMQGRSSHRRRLPRHPPAIPGVPMTPDLTNGHVDSRVFRPSRGSSIRAIRITRRTPEWPPTFPRSASFYPGIERKPRCNRLPCFSAWTPRSHSTTSLRNTACRRPTLRSIERPLQVLPTPPVRARSLAPSGFDPWRYALACTRNRGIDPLRRACGLAAGTEVPTPSQRSRFTSQ